MSQKEPNLSDVLKPGAMLGDGNYDAVLSDSVLKNLQGWNQTTSDRTENKIQTRSGRTETKIQTSSGRTQNNSHKTAGKVSDISKLFGGSNVHYRQ